MKIPKILFAVVLALSALGCSSIVAPGQDRAALEESGATKWTLSEYDVGPSHFVWVPTWREGLLGLSTPKATNCKRLTVLEFKGGILIGQEDLGNDRDAWAAKLEEHGRFKRLPQTIEADPLYLAVALQIVHIGASKEAVYFAKGFPMHGAQANPRSFRAPAEIHADDVLYFLKTRGGSANEIVMKDGRVAEVRDAQPLSKFWQSFYFPILPY